MSERAVWFLGGSSGTFKRVHREGCRYARDEYKWAGERTAAELVDALTEHGGVMWHAGCLRCSGDLDALISVARARHIARVIEDHYAAEGVQ